jgi:hypothetical protein
MSKQARPDYDPNDRPWEQPGAVRRDAEPHRGEFLRQAAGLSLATAGTAAVGCFCLPAAVAAGLFAVGLGIVVWVLAQRDLTEMDHGRKDSTGRRHTARALRSSRYGVLWGVLAVALCTGFNTALLNQYLSPGGGSRQWWGPAGAGVTVFLTAAAAVVAGLIGLANRRGS